MSREQEVLSANFNFQGSLNAQSKLKTAVKTKRVLCSVKLDI